jgi:hypothetical protein
MNSVLHDLEDMPLVVLFQNKQITMSLFNMLDGMLGQVAYDLLVMLPEKPLRAQFSKDGLSLESLPRLAVRAADEHRAGRAIVRAARAHTPPARDVRELRHGGGNRRCFLQHDLRHLE